MQPDQAVGGRVGDGHEGQGAACAGGLVAGDLRGEVDVGEHVAVEHEEAVVLVTEWDEFRTLDWHEVADVMLGTVLIDGRNALDPAAVRAAGLAYEGIGRS